MTDETNTAEATKAPAKSKTVYTSVDMEDGSKHEFPGSRLVDKDYVIGEDGVVTAVFKFRNGAVRKLASNELNTQTLLTLIGHGTIQKVGDEWSDAKSKSMSIDDIVMTCDEIIARLKKGEFNVVKEGGDSMAGASLVIRAIIEDTKTTKGKDVSVEQVKAFLDAQLQAAKDKGQTLTRQALYASFKKPGSRTATIIERMEREKLAKQAVVDTDSLLDAF